MHTDGAYAEYTTVDPKRLHPIPEELDLRHAAITEPTSIATRAVFDRSVTRPGDTVLVEGPGPIGVLIAAVADSMGANVLVPDIEQDAAYRLPLVEELGSRRSTSSTRGLGTGRTRSPTASGLTSFSTRWATAPGSRQPSSTSAKAVRLSCQSLRRAQRGVHDAAGPGRG